MTEVKIPKFGASKPGPKSKQQITAVATRRGRPPSAVKAKMEEIKAKMVLVDSDTFMQVMRTALKDPSSPGHVTALKFFGERIAPLSIFDDGLKAPSTISITLTDFTGEETVISSGPEDDIEDIEFTEIVGEDNGN